MKKLLLLLAITCTLSLYGCASDGTETPTTEPVELEVSDQSTFMWQIEALSHELTVYMESSGAMTLYDGSVERTDYTDGAESGKIYLLLELNILKAEVGNEPFTWSDVYIEDAEGNTYTRLEDDLFLENHGYSRLPSTDIKLGESIGFIAFELDELAADNALYLVHNAIEGENRNQIQ